MSFSRSKYLCTSSLALFRATISTPVSVFIPLSNTYLFRSDSFFRWAITSIFPSFKYLIDSIFSTYFLPLLLTTISESLSNNTVLRARVLELSYSDIWSSASSCIVCILSDSYHDFISAFADSSLSPVYFDSSTL